MIKSLIEVDLSSCVETSSSGSYDVSWIDKKDSYSDVIYGIERAQWVDELMMLPEKFSELGWNGYAALPLSPKSLLVAIDFARRYACKFPLPRIVVDPNGYVCFKWIKSRNDRLELTFPNGGGFIALLVDKGEREIGLISSYTQVTTRARMLIDWGLHD